MVTGYDHLAFLVGVIFFLYKLKDVVAYVSLFTLGHSITLLAGVLGNIHANSFVVDAIIGFSVVYKAFDNMGGFKKLLGFEPNTKVAVLIFGLFHGFGLATKIQELDLSEKRSHRQHRQLQRGGGNWAGSRTGGSFAGAELLAHATWLSSTRVCGQHCPDVRGVHADRISDCRLLPRVMIGENNDATAG